MVVQHTLSAVNFSRRLEVASSLQASSMERLSSGYQINKVADNGADLSISEKTKVQMKGFDRSATSAQDGVSAVQTAESALSDVQSKLQLMREYAMQASDETKSKDDRDALQSEIEQLCTEINGLAETTCFNETYLLKGSDHTVRQYPKAHDAGLQGKMTDEATKATFEMSELKEDDQVVIGGKEYTVSYTTITHGRNIDYASLASDYALKENNARVEKNKYDFASSEYNQWDRREAFCRSRRMECQRLEQTYSTRITADEAYEKIQEELTEANNIGTSTKQSEVTKSVDKEKGMVTFAIEKGYTEVNAPLNYTIHVGSDAETTNKVPVNIKAMTTANLGLEGLNVSDETGRAASYAIDAITDAIGMVSEQSTLLGETQNMLEKTIFNVDNVEENTTLSNELIRFSKNNILEQAYQAMLAQANQSTQSVFSLLQ